MRHLPTKVSRNTDVSTLPENLSQLPTFSQPIAGTNQLDVEIMEIQAETFLRLGSMNLEAIRSQTAAHVEVTRIQAYTAISMEWMKLDAAETAGLISSTEKAISKSLDVYRGNGMPSSFNICAKTKLSGLFGTGLFGRSCTITVEARSYQAYYCRGPVR